MNELTGKKILFICPSFFGYEKEIESELRLLGATVDFYDERPFRSSVLKIINRLNFKRLIRNKITQHYDSILNVAKIRKYDVLFVVNPETMPSGFIKKLKQVCNNIHTVLYLWDSLRNKKNAADLIGEFERVFTFDKNDVNSNKKLEFLPLFYTRTYDYRNNHNKGDCELKYHAAFVGTAHSDRFCLVKKIICKLPASSFNNFIFLYCPSRLLYFLKKLFSHELRDVSLSDISFKSMNSTDIANVLMKSLFVIDIEHPNQNGLTMRTIEMLGMQKKLITTNKNIMEYDFYNPKNICVVDRIEPSINDDFIYSDYEPIEISMLDKYSLNNWLKTLLL
ncbi:hypothetical protein [Aeromonas veronii]